MFILFHVGIFLGFEFYINNDNLYKVSLLYNGLGLFFYIFDLLLTLVLECFLVNYNKIKIKKIINYYIN